MRSKLVIMGQRNKPLSILIKETREKAQINKIRNEKGEVTTNATENQSIQETTTNNYMPIK